MWNNTPSPWTNIGSHPLFCFKNGPAVLSEYRRPNELDRVFGQVRNAVNPLTFGIPKQKDDEVTTNKDGRIRRHLANRWG